MWVQTQSQTFKAIAVVIVQSLFVSCDGKITVQIRSDSPALESAPINFYAELIGADNSTKYEFLWKDDTSGSNFPPDDQGGLTRKLTTTYPKRGNYVMTVIVKTKSMIPRFSKIVAENSTSFRITDTINGKLVVSSERPQPLEPSQDVIVATNEMVNVSFHLYDPNKYLENTTFMYPWKLDSDLVEIHNPYVQFNFTEAKTHLVTLMVVVYGFNIRYVGNFEMNLVAKDPIRTIDVDGKTSLKLGDLFKVDITCDGSPPWSYCWFFAPGDLNTSNAVCSDVLVTTRCDVAIIRFFPETGFHKLMFVVDNDITHQVKVADVYISENVPEPQMLIVIVPLVCCCLALVIIIMGVASFVQSRRHYQVEVADFDFQESENLEYQTFRQRLKESTREAIQGWRKNRRYPAEQCGIESAEEQPDFTR